jgi:hypothetical protein
MCCGSCLFNGSHVPEDEANVSADDLSHDEVDKLL